MAVCVGEGLRKQLKSAAYPPRGEDPLQQQIIPINEITKYLTRDVIVELLECPCEKHRARASIHALYGTKIDNYAKKILGIPADSETFPAIKILALLILVKESPLIADIIKHNVYDPNYEKLSEENLQRFIEGIPTETARKISRRKWCLNPPVLRYDEIHENFDKNILMPFYQSETPIGSGSYGNVYELEIHPSYQKLVPINENEPRPRFARKELIRRTDQTEFDIERENLELIQKLKNKHLIKILKTYRHGDKLNFLFPLADCSLHDYLNRPTPEDDVAAWPFWTHWLWDQLAGVADALASMSSFQEEKEERRDPYSKWFGYHLDLKPSNILITGKGNERTLVITDFGQAYFKIINRDGTLSSISPNPCGVIYTPPDDRVDSKGRINRSFDVWSFGCILLEVAIYIIEGMEELQRFREDRNAPTSTDPDSLGIAACFYQLRSESDGGRSFQIRTVVLDRIRKLRERVDHKFVDGITKLIEDIFKRKETRPTARAVSDRLRDLLVQREGNNELQRASREVEQAMKLREQDGDETLGDDDLKKMRLFYTFSHIGNDRDWFECDVELQRNKRTDVIKIHTRSREVVSQIVVDRKRLLLDPLYALGKHRHQLGFKDFALRYRFREMKELLHFQSIITKQDVLINLKVTDVILELKKNVLGKEQLLEFSRGEDSQPRVQLWLSRALVPPAGLQPPMARADSRSVEITGPTGKPKNVRPPREAPDPVDGFVRIVIYLDVGILIIRVNYFADVVKQENGNGLEVKPYEGRSSFTAYMIDSSSDRLPGIPICEDLLKVYEDENKYKHKLTRIRISNFPEYIDQSEATDLFMKQFDTALGYLERFATQSAMRRAKTSR